MPILESALSRKIAGYARSFGCLAIKLDASCVGYPDRIIIYPSGKIIFVEVKRLGCKPSPVQQHIIGELQRRGVLCTWVDCFESFREFFNAHKID